MKRSSLAASLITFLLLMFGAGGSGYAQTSAGPLPIKIGWQPSEQAGFFLAQSLNLFETHGLSPEYIKFEAGVPMLAALQSSSIDVAIMGTPPALIGMDKGIPAKIVNISDDSGGTEGLIVRSGISSMNDLRGKRIAVARGSSADYGLIMALRKYNMTAQDINIIDMKVTAMVPAWTNNDVDAIYVWEPFVQQLLALGGKKLLTDSDVGAAGALVWVARNDFIKGSPKTLQAFIATLDDATQRMQKGDKQAALSAMMRLMNLTKEQATAIYDGSRYPTVAQQLSPSDPLSIDPEAVKSGNGLVKSFRNFAEFLITSQRITTVPDIAAGIDPGPSVAYLKTTGK